MAKMNYSVATYRVSEVSKQTVTPAQASVQKECPVLDSRFRENDVAASSYGVSTKDTLL